MLAILLTLAQDIPKGVVYKRATAAVNALAEAKLKKFYAKKVENADFLPMPARPVVIGPTLTHLMKNVAKSFKQVKPVTFMVPGQKKNLELKGMIPLGSEEQEMTWISIHMSLSKTGKVTIRKAKAVELSYYWSIIPYDLQEPIWVAESGKRAILFDFDDNAKDPRVSFVDAIPPKK